MLIIRATNKVLKVSRIVAIKQDTILTDNFPGEWYVDLISLGRPGKFGLHFLHHPSMISVVVPGRSLLTTHQIFVERVVNLLQRSKCEKLIPFYQLDTVPDILATNSRSMIAYLNQVKRNSEYHCINAKSVDKINYSWIENILLDCLFGTKDAPNKYFSPKDRLKNYIELGWD
jgi:hypothetical protein